MTKNKHSSNNLNHHNSGNNSNHNSNDSSNNNCDNHCSNHNSNNHDADHLEHSIIALNKIVNGFRKFKTEIFPNSRELFGDLSVRQNPLAMFITCADSRIVPDLITQSAPGDLFITRNVGNIVPPYGQMMGGVSTAIEYAVLALGVQHIIVCGHSDCGAMKAVLDPVALKLMPTVKIWLRHSETALKVVEANCDLVGDEKLRVLTQENVIAQLTHLHTHPAVVAKVASGNLFIHGWIYDIKTCEILAFDAMQGIFLPLDGEIIPVATPKARYK